MQRRAYPIQLLHRHKTHSCRVKSNHGRASCPSTIAPNRIAIPSFSDTSHRSILGRQLATTCSTWATTDDNLPKEHEDIPQSVRNIFLAKKRIKVKRDDKGSSYVQGTSKIIPTIDSDSISFLVRQFKQSGEDVDMAEVVSVLRSKLLPTLDTGKFIKNCDSGPAFEAWSSVPAREDQKGRIQSINLLLRVFMDLAVKSRGEDFVSRRLDYFLACWRYVAMTQEAVDKCWVPELERLRDLAETLERTTGLTAPFYFYFVTMIAHNSRQSKEILATFKNEQVDLLLNEAVANARASATRDSDASKPSLASRVPPAFASPNTEIFRQRVSELPQLQKLELKSHALMSHLIKLDAYRGLALWNSGSRSDGIALVAETLEVGLGLGASRRTFVEAGSSSVHCLSLIAEDVVQDPELAPAKEFILLMGEKLTALQGVAVVPYILHAQLVSAGEISDLPDKYPLMLQMLKAPAKFETSLARFRTAHPSEVDRTCQRFLQEVLSFRISKSKRAQWWKENSERSTKIKERKKSEQESEQSQIINDIFTPENPVAAKIDCADREIATKSSVNENGVGQANELDESLSPSQETTIGIQKDSAIKVEEDTTDQQTLHDGPAAIYEGSADDFVKFSPKVAKEMLDIEILELCKNGNFDTALRMVQSASSRGHWPSDVVVMMFAQSLIKDKDVTKLEALELALPYESPVSEKVYEQVVKLKLMANYSTYKEGSRSLALEDLMHLYQRMWEDESLVGYEALEAALTKARRLAKLYSEEFVGSNNIAALEVLRKYGKVFSDQFGDYRLSLLYWEVLFFSSKYQHQLSANEFLEANPKAAQHFEVDPVLRRAVDSGEEYVKKILEITLRHDLDMYNQSKALETLLAFQCDSGDMKGASETVRYANEREITIGADAMKIFLDASKENPRRKPVMSWLEFKNPFWRTKK